MLHGLLKIRPVSLHIESLEFEMNISWVVAMWENSHSSRLFTYNSVNLLFLTFKRKRSGPYVKEAMYVFIVNLFLISY